MSRLLVTGGAGFIGANFVRFWRNERPADIIVVLDALTYAGNPANLDGLEKGDRLTLVKGDICDEYLVRQLFAKHDFDRVVHFAAESHVDRSIAAPDDFIRTNIAGTHTLLKVAASLWPMPRENRRFHHVSTDEVFGSLEPSAAPFSETSPYDPRSPYAASKAAADFLVRAYANTYGLPITISNCSNNYGPYQFPEKLIPLVMINALEGKPLPVYGDGGNIRDWLFVEDHCRAVMAILDHGRMGQTYNVGGMEELTNLDLIRRLCALLDARFLADPRLAERFPSCPAAKGKACFDLVAFVKDRPGHDRRYAIDPSKIERELGFHPSRDFTAGLAETVDWYIANQAWWRPIQSGAYRDWIKSHYG